MEKARRLLGGALLGLTVGSGVSFPRDFPKLALTVIQGRGVAQDRLLFLPIHPLGGLSYQISRLDRLVPGLGRGLLRHFLSLEDLPEVSLPEGVSGAGFLFGAGGGAFRLEGNYREEQMREFLKLRGLEVTARGEHRASFLGKEVWGWQEGGLLYGAWGDRPQRFWLEGLDGLGRCLYQVRGLGRKEILHFWRDRSGFAAEDLACFLTLQGEEMPFPLQRAGFDLRLPSRKGGRIRVRVRLIPEAAGDLEELREFLRMTWMEPVDAQITLVGPGVEIAWGEEPGPLGDRLARWGRIFDSWMRGDRYRTLQ
jgi:hypothetical protein